MRNLVLFLHLSLDGFSAAEDGGLDWIPYSKAFEKYNDKIVGTIGTPVYGRVTYELMKGYWPSMLTTDSAEQHDKDHAEWLEGVEKIVISKTLPEQDWKNTRIIHENVVEELTKLKQTNGKDLGIFGSMTLASSLIESGIIDEFQFTISPVILGKGKTFIRNIEKKIPLELITSEAIEGGILGLHYRVA
jgi:dihydrofolate reductase